MVLGDYFAQIITGLTEALYELDMQAVLCPTFHHKEREITLVNQLLEGTIDGAILVLPERVERRAPAPEAAGVVVRRRRRGVPARR